MRGRRSSGSTWRPDPQSIVERADQNPGEIWRPEWLPLPEVPPIAGLRLGVIEALCGLGVPVIDRKVSEVLSRAGFAPDSHSGKDLMGVLENYPRDELFQADTDAPGLYAVRVTEPDGRVSMVRLAYAGTNDANVFKAYVNGVTIPLDGGYIAAL